MLSDEQIDAIADACDVKYVATGEGDYGSNIDSIIPFARAIEAEVHKQDNALILQLVAALDECKDSTQERIDTLTESGIDKHKPRYFRSYVQDLQRAADAISAARVRLESKP